MAGHASYIFPNPHSFVLSENWRLQLGYTCKVSLFAARTVTVSTHGLWLHLVPWRLPWAPCAAPAHPWRWRALPTCIPRLTHVTAAPLGACSVRRDRVCAVIAGPLSVRIIVKMDAF